MCLIRIGTDDGLAGYGSPSGPYDLAVLDRIVRGVIAPHLVGADPGHHVHLWHRLYHGEISRNVGTCGVGIAALSGVDVALWDLRARAAALPLHQLLGGRYHVDGVRAYASSIYWDLEPSAAAEQARAHVEEGFTAVKLKVGREPRRDLARVQAIRSEVGPGVELLVDANQSLGRADALSMLAGLEEAGVYWFEEPLGIDDVEGYRLLRRARRSVRIATGENLYTRHAFVQLLQREAVDVLQADASRAGGLTEVAGIAALAAAHHADWSPHTFNDILTVLANLHLVVAAPHRAMFEWDITYNNLMTRLTTTPLCVEQGRLTPPARPGLGVEIDWDFVAAHPWNGEPSMGAGHGMRG